MEKRLKILQINTCNFGSTGSVMLSISKCAEEHDCISYVSYADSRSNRKKEVGNSLLIGSILERNMHLLLAYYTGLNGCFSRIGTKKFLEKVDNINPDVIHLHNLHNCYINLESLFNYIKARNIPVVWTLHDCWPFTGQCPHFTTVKCEKWKMGCFDCPQYKEYPASRIDKTKEMYMRKRTWFTDVDSLTIVTPSQWLADLVKESFLKEYPVSVINNGLDLDIFKPTHGGFRNKYKIEDKIVLLGVSSPWSNKKGLNTFINLAESIDDNFKIVLLGLTEKQIRELPQNVLGIERTNNPREIAEIYTSADIFINPTLEDNFPTTNLEAMACGTPVITYNTGGSVEVINEYTGRIVESNKMDELIIRIGDVLKEGKEKYRKERLANAPRYDSKSKFEEYIELYFSISKWRR